MKTSTLPPSNESQTAPKEHRRAWSDTSNLIRVCALGLLISFFLPWVGFIGQSLSGFDLQKMPGQLKWLWLIPIFSGITIFVPVMRRYQKIAALLTGVLPFCVLAYGLNQLGSELLSTLGFGGWLSFVFGLALLILPHRLK